MTYTLVNRRYRGEEYNQDNYEYEYVDDDISKPSLTLEDIEEMEENEVSTLDDILADMIYEYGEEVGKKVFKEYLESEFEDKYPDDCDPMIEYDNISETEEYYEIATEEDIMQYERLMLERYRVLAENNDVMPLRSVLVRLT